MSGFTIRRTFTWFGYVRRLNVYVDDVRIGDLIAGETRMFEAAQGLHRVHVKMDWCRSPSVEVAVLPTGGPTLDAGITFGLWGLVLCPLSVFFWHKRFFSLEPRDARGTAR